MKATITSKKGFYVGDPCYVLGDDVYYNVWGHDYEFKDCVVKDPKTGMRFAVHRTKYGDGGYYSKDGTLFGVDSGTLAVVPFELIENWDGVRCGGQYHGSGKATFEESGGVFSVTLPSGFNVVINTTDDEIEDDYDEDDYEDDCDYEVGYDPYTGCFSEDL